MKWLEFLCATLPGCFPADLWSLSWLWASIADIDIKLVRLTFPSSSNFSLKTSSPAWQACSRRCSSPPLALFDQRDPISLSSICSSDSCAWRSQIISCDSSHAVRCAFLLWLSPSPAKRMGGGEAVTTQQKLHGWALLLTALLDMLTWPLPHRHTVHLFSFLAFLKHATLVSTAPTFKHPYCLVGQ